MTSLRVTITDDQLKENTAKELLVLLETVSADGRLTDDEILKLDSWLKTAKSENLPALTFLRGRVEGVLADRVIIDDERRSIVAAILRVMPKPERELARNLFDEAVESERQQRSWELKTQNEQEPATDVQKACLRAMRCEIPENCSKAEATELINKAMGAGLPVTNRQLTILRFWNKLELADTGRMYVAEWLDSWYADDPDRLTAWTLWLEEHPHAGREDPPEGVPVDIGAAYLNRVKVLGPELYEEKRKSPLYVRLTAIVLMIVAIVLIYFML